MADELFALVRVLDFGQKQVEPAVGRKLSGQRRRVGFAFERKVEGARGDVRERRDIGHAQVAPADASDPKRKGVACFDPTLVEAILIGEDRSLMKGRALTQ